MATPETVQYTALTLMFAASAALDGTISYAGSTTSAPRTTGFRSRWTPQPDGRVRQQFYEHGDSGWQPWFDGWYTRTGSTAVPAPIPADAAQTRHSP